MPSHNHEILYGTTGDRGGIYGTNSLTGGNYGNPLTGTAGYAHTAYAGAGYPYYHTPKSYGIVNYICVK